MSVKKREAVTKPWTKGTCNNRTTSKSVDYETITPTWRRSTSSLFIQMLCSLLSLDLFSAIPKLLSVEVCNGNASIRKLMSRPPPPMAAISHTMWRPPANAAWTLCFSSSSMPSISGMIEYATAVPSGNCEMNSVGRRVFSWFCRIAPPTVTPQIYRRSDMSSYWINLALLAYSPERRTVGTSEKPEHSHATRLEWELGQGKNRLSWQCRDRLDRALVSRSRPCDWSSRRRSWIIQSLSPLLPKRTKAAVCIDQSS